MNWSCKKFQILGCVFALGTSLLLLAEVLFAENNATGVDVDVPVNAENSGKSTSPTQLQSRLQDRSPEDLELGADETWLATANRSSNSVSLISLPEGELLDELEVGKEPVSIVRCKDGSHVLVTCLSSGEVWLLQVANRKFTSIHTWKVGFEPYGLAVTQQGTRAYVSLSASGEIVELDLNSLKEVRTFDAGRVPRHIAVTTDGKRLAVSSVADRGISLIDIPSGKRIHVDKFVGINFGQLYIPPQKQTVYFPWMVYRQNPITPSNIKLGWVLASRLGRKRTDIEERREALSLDPPGKAIADPHGIRVTSDGQFVMLTSAGTHELLILKEKDLPYQSHGGTDHIPQELLDDKAKFTRIELGGRPLGLRLSKNDKTVYVANSLLNSVQVIDLETKRLKKSFPVGDSPEPSLARQGEFIFYDARRSLDQWYSCASCHYEGGSNAIAMDTLNDGSRFTFKTVLPLQGIEHTSPWTWHGWQKDLEEGVRKSLTTTMQGKSPSDHDVKALTAFLKTLKLPRNPYRNVDGSLTEQGKKGQQIFESDVAGCANCHAGAWFSDGEIHNVGTGDNSGPYRGFNTPTLRGVYRKVRFLHDGRTDSLKELLTDDHNPENVSGTRKLTETELQDLIHYLKSL